MDSDSSRSVELDERSSGDAEMDWDTHGTPAYENVQAIDLIDATEEMEVYSTSKSLDYELRTPIGSDDDEVQSTPTREPISMGFFLGRKYGSLNELRDEIKDYSRKNGYNIKFIKSERSRLTAECDDECGWRLHASKMQDEVTFQIKTLIDSHTCARVIENRHASAKWVATEYLDRFKSHPTWDISSVIETVRKDFTVEISPSLATRARSIARTLNEGKADEQYGLLNRYAAEIFQTNPRSTVKIYGVPAGHKSMTFQRLYICMAAYKAGLLQCGRPLICLDGCHLKGPCPGQLLTAVSIDGNDGVYPIAIANVESEWADSWTWFLKILKEDLDTESGYGWTIVSDRQKCLKKAVRDQFGQAEHCFCLRHMYANFKNQFRGRAFRDAMWNAARAPTSHHFEHEMMKLRDLNQEAEAYLRRKEPKYWASHAFSPTPKCDLGLNNLSESFNAMLLPVRDKPILTMFEMIRKCLMTRIVKKFEKLAQITDLLCPKIRKKLEKLESASRNWSAVFAGGSRFQVSNGSKQYIVDMNMGVCNCTRWELTGIPCVHSIPCMHLMRQSPENYVYAYYHRATYLQMYSHYIYPISGQMMWPTAEGLNDILPPKRKRQPGRPKKTRVRDADEPSSSKMSKRNSTLRCGICRQQGHNTRTCPNRGSTSGTNSQNTFMGFRN